MTKSLMAAYERPGLDEAYVAYPGKDSFPLGENMQTVSLARVLEQRRGCYLPLSPTPCIAYLYGIQCPKDTWGRTVIKSFRHKGLKKFFESGSTAGIQPAHADKLRRQLARLDSAKSPQDMNIPGWNLHPLKGEMKGHWSAWVNGNWRMTFHFEGEDAEIVDYQDYH